MKIPQEWLADNGEPEGLLVSLCKELRIRLAVPKTRLEILSRPCPQFREPSDQTQ
jgi:hypothetical protein